MHLEWSLKIGYKPFLVVYQLLMSLAELFGLEFQFQQPCYGAATSNGMLGVTHNEIVLVLV